MSAAHSHRASRPTPLAACPFVAGATDVGVVRRVNQDAFGRYENAERGELLLVVADGLGGHQGGETASRMATELLGPLVASGDDPPDQRLVRAIEETNRQIHDESRRDYTKEGMGTTVVCLLIASDGPSFVAHVGDSRLYRMREGRIESLTEDHSLVAALVRQGALSPEEARTDPRRNQILRALGVRKDVEIDVAVVEPRPGDTYLLCTDGLHGLIDEPAILALAEADAREPAGTRPPIDAAVDLAVARLIDAAKCAGGTDNVTCMLARFPAPVPAPVLAASASADRAGPLSRLFASARAWWRPRDTA